MPGAARNPDIIDADRVALEQYFQFVRNVIAAGDGEVNHERGGTHGLEEGRRKKASGRQAMP